MTTVNTVTQGPRRDAVPKYSAPRVSATKYTVYPTGYDESPFSDSYSFCIYVEQFHDTGRWRIHDGFERGGQLVSRTGRWIDNTPLNRQWTRFDTAEEAIAVAVKAVDTRPHRNLVEWIESPRGQEIAKRGRA
jgi:hypothetical protein